MYMELTHSARKGHHYFMYLFIFFPPSCQQSAHLPEGLHFLLKVRQYCPTHLSDHMGLNSLQMPQQVSIFSYSSHGLSLKKSMTSELVYIPNINKHCTDALTRITVHKRCSALAIWRGRTAETGAADLVVHIEYAY